MLGRHGTTTDSLVNQGPRVSAATARLIKGAASNTNGVMISQAMSHDLSHWLANMPWPRNGALAIAVAMAVVTRLE